MTEKELHRLRRHELLQLLLAQGREAALLQEQLNEMEYKLENLQNTNERFVWKMDEKDARIEKLKGRLDEKDARVERFKERLKEKDIQIERLKGRLEQKDAKIAGMMAEMEEYRSGRIFEMGGPVSIAGVAQKLEGIFTAAQRAVDRYLEELEDGIGNEDGTGEQDEKKGDGSSDAGTAGGGAEKGTV